jgi:hypothetical protein
MEQVLNVPAPVSADADEADPKSCGRPLIHRSSVHGRL